MCVHLQVFNKIQNIAVAILPESDKPMPKVDKSISGTGKT